MDITVLRATKDYVVVKVPRELAKSAGLFEQELTESDALKILRSGVKEYRLGKTKKLNSLRDFLSFPCCSKG